MRRVGYPSWARVPAQSLFALIVILALVLPASGQDVPIEVKRKWLEQAIQETLFEMYPDPRQLEKTLKLLRGVGAGSWLNGTAGKGSDIDFTLGHPNPKVEEELARRVQAKIDRRYDAVLETAAKQKGLKALPRPGSHEVKVINSRVQDWDELFSGPTGQRFFLDYANKTGGNACFKWKPVKDASGKIVRLEIALEPTEDFWRVTQGKVPRQLTNPASFVDESLAMLGKAGKGTVQGRAQAAAKYLSNTQRWLVPGLEQQWGAKLNDLRVRPDEQKLADFLLNIKKKPAAQQMELLKIHFNVKTDEEVGRKLANFADKVELRLNKLSDDVKYLDELSKTGRLGRLGGAPRALSLKKALTEAFSTTTGRIMLAVDVVAIIIAYQDGGPTAAALETAAAAASMAVPPAAIAALVAEVGRQVFAATAGWAINAAIFDPINDMAIKKFYTPGSSCYLFRNGPVPFISPFRGLTRETIAYKYSSQEQIRAAANRFLGQVKGVGCGWHTTTGWGDISGRLFGRLYRDFRISQQIADKVREISLKSRAGLYIAPLKPFRVLVNGRPVELAPAGQPIKTARIVEKTQPGQSAEFHIKIAREYGMWQGLDPKAESLYEVWGKRGGWAAMRRYAQEHTLEMINTGLAPSMIDAAFGESKGWSMQGMKPGRRDFYMSNTERRKWRYLDHAVKLTPGKEAAGQAQARIKLTLSGDTPGAPQLQGEMVLTVKIGEPDQPKPPATPTAPAGPVVRLSCDDPLRTMTSGVILKAAVEGGKRPFRLKIRIKSPGGGIFKQTTIAMKARELKINWKSSVPKPGVYEILAQADGSGVSSPWSQPLAILVQEEDKPAPPPPPVIKAKPKRKPKLKKGPCKYEVLNTFTGNTPQINTGYAKEKDRPSVARHTVQMPGPGTLRITMGVSGKNKWANTRYGACRRQARATLSSPPSVGLKGWVAGGTYYPGVRDYGENSYSWKVKAGGPVTISVKPEACSYSQWTSSKRKIVRGCACLHGKDLGYKPLSHAYKLIVEFKPCK